MIISFGILGFGFDDVIIDGERVIIETLGLEKIALLETRP